jgi:hypothetical protein
VKKDKKIGCCVDWRIIVVEGKLIKELETININ